MPDSQASVQSHGCQSFTVPVRVTTGVPLHRTSILVVCPLHKGVSRHTSANCPCLMCFSMCATSLNRILPDGRPSCWAASCRLCSPIALKCSKYNTEFRTCYSIWWGSVLCKLLVPVCHFISQYKSAALYYWLSRLQYHSTVLCNYSCLKTNCLLMWNSKVPSPCLQEPDSGPHPEPTETSTYFHILFLFNPF
jgi:hypothetical protein